MILAALLPLSLFWKVRVPSTSMFPPLMIPLLLSWARTSTVAASSITIVAPLALTVVPTGISMLFSTVILPVTVIGVMPEAMAFSRVVYT